MAEKLSERCKREKQVTPKKYHPTRVEKVALCIPPICLIGSLLLTIGMEGTLVQYLCIVGLTVLSSIVVFRLLRKEKRYKIN